MQNRAEERFPKFTIIANSAHSAFFRDYFGHPLRTVVCSDGWQARCWDCFFFFFINSSRRSKPNETIVFICVAHKIASYENTTKNKHNNNNDTSPTTNKKCPHERGSTGMSEGAVPLQHSGSGQRGTALPAKRRSLERSRRGLRLSLHPEHARRPRPL